MTHSIETQHLKECCQPGKLTLVFGAQSFYWGSITYCPYGWPLVFNPSWKLGIITLVCSPSRGQNYYGDFHVPIIYHIVTLPITKGPGQTDTFLSGRTFQGTRDHLPVARGKGQTSPRLKVNLHYTKGLKTSEASLIILALKLPPIYNVRFLLNIEHCFPHYLYNFFFLTLNFSSHPHLPLSLWCSQASSNDTNLEEEDAFLTPKNNGPFSSISILSQAFIKS